MAFDAAMLTLGVGQAFLAIPPAIQALKDLLKKNPGDPKTLELLKKLTDHLCELDQVSGWLQETKRAHELLQGMDIALEGAEQVYQAATKEGAFDFQKYDLAKVRAAWAAVRQHHFQQFLVFAQNIRFVEPAPLVQDTQGNFVSGPEWAKRLLEHRQFLESRFAKISKSKTQKNIEVLADHVDQLVSYTKSLILQADEKLRLQAGDLGTQLAKLTGALKGV